MTPTEFKKALLELAKIATLKSDEYFLKYQDKECMLWKEIYETIFNTQMKL